MKVGYISVKTKRSEVLNRRWAHDRIYSMNFVSEYDVTVC